MSPFGEEESHPSYGVLGIHRVSGRRANLFGSALKEHDSTIRITLKAAVVSNDLSQDWFFGRGAPLFEVEMSHAQFAEMITSLNVGDGVPCTILARCAGKPERVEDPPDRLVESHRAKEQFIAEIEATAANAKAVTARVREILEQKTLKKADKEEILSAFGKYVRMLTDHAPFVVEQFSRATEKVVAAAKTEIDAFVMTMIHRTGLSELKRLQAALPASTDPVKAEHGQEDHRLGLPSPKR